MSQEILKIIKDRGLKILNAKDHLFLQVTKSDIQKAKVKNSGCCAFAQAAKRSLGTTDAHFGRSTAWLIYPDRAVRFLLPESMRVEIVAFDRGGKFAPGVYGLSPPPKSNRIGHFPKRKKKEATKAANKTSSGKAHKATPTVKSSATRAKKKIRVVHRTASIRNWQKTLT